MRSPLRRRSPRRAPSRKWATRLPPLGCTQPMCPTPGSPPWGGWARSCFRTCSCCRPTRAACTRWGSCRWKSTRPAGRSRYCPTCTLPPPRAETPRSMVGRRSCSISAARGRTVASSAARGAPPRPLQAGSKRAAAPSAAAARHWRRGAPPARGRPPRHFPRPPARRHATPLARAGGAPLAAPAAAAAAARKPR